jgi:hypothetical protein
MKLLQLERKKESEMHANQTAHSSDSEFDVSFSNDKKNKNKKNGAVAPPPDLKIVKMEEQICESLQEIIGLKTGQILDE